MERRYWGAGEGITVVTIECCYKSITTILLYNKT